MPLFSGKIEIISTTPDEELSSVDQIDCLAFSRALCRKSSYKAYSALLIHRRTLQCLNANVNLIVQEAEDARFKAFENREKTEQALANACISTMSSYPTRCPSIARKALESIMELQTFYLDERAGALVECVLERECAQAFLYKADKRLKKVEQALVERNDIHTVDDEGEPLDVQNVERVMHVMASIPGIERLWETKDE